MIASVVALTLTAALRGRRRPGEITEAFGRRVRRGVDGSEHLVPGRRRRADAGRADAGVAGLLAEAAALIGEAGGVAGTLETEVAGTADHVLDHTGQLLAALAGVLDHHRLAEVASLRNEAHVAATHQRRLLQLTALLLAHRRAGDRYVGMKIVLRVRQTTFRRNRAGGVLRGSRRAVQIIFPRQLRRRCRRFRADGPPTGRILVCVVAARVPRELPSAEGRTVAGRLAGG